jgi:hypothetical protein
MSAMPESLKLSIEEPDNDVQDNSKQYRKQAGGHNGKVKKAAASLDADVTGQPANGESQPGSKKHSPTDQDQDHPTNNQPTSEIFHKLPSPTSNVESGYSCNLRL